MYLDEGVGVLVDTIFATMERQKLLCSRCREVGRTSSIVLDIEKTKDLVSIIYKHYIKEYRG